MARVIDTGGANSSASGASTTISTSAINNAIDDLLILVCAVPGSTPPTFTTPSGWTLYRSDLNGDVRASVFYKQATSANESIPDVTISSSANWISTVVSVRGADFVGGPFGNIATTTSGTDTDPTSPSVTTSASNSLILHYLIKERRTVDAMLSRGRPQQLVEIKTFQSTGGESNQTDVHCGMIRDFEATSGTSITGPTWDAPGSLAENIMYSIEVLGDGTEAPPYFITTPSEDIDSSSYSVSTDDSWRDAIMDSGVAFPDGSSQTTYSFDASSDINTGTDSITITGHGIIESRIVRANANGNTLPTGITDGAYYYVAVTDANTITLRSAEAEATSSANWFINNGTPLATVDITATGSGTCQLIDCGLQWTNINSAGAFARPPNGHTSGFTNSYGASIEFSTPRDMSNETFGVNAVMDGHRLMHIVMIDSDGDWKCWRTGVELIPTENQYIAIDPQSTGFQGQGGTFDETSVEHIVFLMSTITTGDRPFSAAVTLPPQSLTTLNIAGGTSSSPLTWKRIYDELQKYNALSSLNASGLQFIFLHSLKLGDGHLTTDDKIFLEDTEKAFSFPTFSDDETDFRNYFNSFTFTYDLNAASSVNLRNDLIGASNTFALGVDTDRPAGATINMNGQIIVNATVTLQSDDTLSNVNFIGGNGITYNNATMTNCQFTNINRADGYILLTTTHNFTTPTFNADDSGDYAMEIDTAGDYDIQGFTFTGFTTDINVTATTGTVNLTIANDDATPTYTSAGATVNIIQPTNTFTINSSESNSLIQIFETGTQTIIDSTTGSSLAYDHSDETVDYVVQKAGFLPQRVTGLALSGSPTVTVTLVSDPVYDSSHGLTYTTDASWSRANNELTVPTFGPTVRGVYSLMIDSFIAESTLRNTAFNIQMNGPNSMFLIENAEGDADSSIENMTDGGVRYINTSDVVTAEWCGIQSIGTATGFTGEYQQQDGTGTTDARTTGAFDELIKIYGDASHGNFDYRDHLVLKFQPNGYRPARVDVLSTYGISALEPTLYVVAMEPTAINASTGDPGITITITDHGASPVTWNGKEFSITITDGGTNTGTNILREINYNLSLDATYQGKDPFNWGEMVIESGSNFETIRGALEGDTGATLKGVRVLRGSDPHPDFTRFQADDGTYFTPDVTANIVITGLADATGASNRLQIINTSALTADSWASATAYSEGDMVLRTTGVGTEQVAGLYMRCTTAGTSGGSEPSWDTTVGNTTTDNTATWTTYAVLYYNADPASTSYSSSYVDGEEFASGETYEVRFAEMDAETSFKTYQTTGVVASSGFTLSATMTSDSVYASNGLDGSDYESTFSPDFTNDYIVMDANQDFSGTSAYAYFCYTLTTSQGMYEFWGGVTAVDAANYRINTSILNLYFDETAGFVKQTDSVRIFRSDGARPAIDPTTGGSGIEINWRAQSYLNEQPDLTVIRKMHTNKMVMENTNKTLILYDDDGTTPLYTFEMQDLSGTPSIAEPFRRIPQ